jgi:hypothetical protein
MPEPAENRFEIRDFPGLVQQSDVHDLPAGGAREQTNLESSTPGQLNVRAGYRVVTFEE